MNTTKVLTGLILICLMIFGGFSLLLSDEDTDKLEYDNAVALANDYVKRELYQLAIVEYEKAVAILDSEELRGNILDAYEKRYEEAPEILDAYIDAAKAAISKYPQTADYYVILAKNQERNGDLQAAYKTIDRAKRSGISSDQMEEIYTRIAYLYDIKWYTHEDYHSCVAGFYPVKEDGKWGYLSEEGDHKSGFDYVFASQVGEEGIRILCADKNVLEDEKKMIRGRLSFVPSAAGIYSEGLVAIQKGKEYGYYDSLGDYKFGSYFRASNFSNGKAAVSVKEGEWFFIDASGKRISDNTYQEIRLNLDGSYHKGGVMLAKSGGKYRLYNQQEEQIGNFECDDVDVLTEDGIVAFQNNGKWGFVDTAGNILVEAKFDRAKSFSNGLAAVCQDEKWGFSDKTGKVVIDYQFFDADYFNSKRNCLVKTTAKDWQMLSLLVKF